MNQPIDIASEWMEKIHYQDDQPEVIKSAGFNFQFIDGGAQMTKSASAAISREEADKWKPDDKHFGLHVIAMGSEESVGANRNGDSWPAQALRDYHPTFTKSGCFFREHENRCQKTQGIGQVKFAAYNEPMSRVELILWGDKRKAEEEYEMAKAGKELSFSMSCFPAGTPVSLPDGSDVPIETIQEGSQVLTHKGNTGRVESVQVRDYVGKLVGIRAWGLAEELVMTEDHSVWARVAMRPDAPCPVCGEKFRSLKAHLRQKKDAQHARAYADYVRSTEGFWPAHYLTQKDYVRTAVPTHVNEGGCEDLARVVGYYLAEGSLCVVKQRWENQDGSKNECDCRRVEWTFGGGEIAMANEVADAVERLGHSRPGIFPVKKRNRIQVCSNSAALHDWLLEHCGKFSGQKVLSGEVMGWRPELQRIVLAKWLDGDGHWCSKNLFARGTSVSRQMSMQLLLMAARCGMAGSLSSHQSKATHIMGRPLKKKLQRAYTLTFHTVSDADHLRGEMSKLPDVIPPRKTSWVKSSAHLRHQPEGATVVVTRSSAQDVVRVENGFVYRRIRKVRTFHAALPVYDLTVGGDHGFQTSGIGVSNCRMPFDRCSVCNKKSRSQADYCSHLKNHMLQYLPQMKKYAFARNMDDLKFFDISRVGRRADRVATYLRYMFGDDMAKAASFGQRVITGADWADMEFAGKRGLGSDMLRVFTPWEAATLEKLAAAEHELRGSKASHLAVVRHGAPVGIPQHILLAFAKQGLPEIGGELAKRAMVMDFRSFASIVSGMSPAELDLDGGFRKVASDDLPGLFGSMLDLGGCECGDAAALVAPDEIGCSLSQDKDMIDTMIHEVGDNLGMEEGRMLSRAAKSMDKVASAPVKVLNDGDTNFFKGVLSAYGYYAVKAAHIAKDTGRVSPHLLVRAIPAMNQSFI